MSGREEHPRPRVFVGDSQQMLRDIKQRLKHLTGQFETKTQQPSASNAGPKANTTVVEQEPQSSLVVNRPVGHTQNRRFSGHASALDQIRIPYEASESGYSSCAESCSSSQLAEESINKEVLEKLRVLGFDEEVAGEVLRITPGRTMEEKIDMIVAMKSSGYNRVNFGSNAPSGNRAQLPAPYNTAVNRRPWKGSQETLNAPKVAESPMRKLKITYYQSLKRTLSPGGVQTAAAEDQWRNSWNAETSSNSGSISDEMSWSSSNNDSGPPSPLSDWSFAIDGPTRFTNPIGPLVYHFDSPNTHKRPPILNVKVDENEMASVEDDDQMSECDLENLSLRQLRLDPEKFPKMKNLSPASTKLYFEQHFENVMKSTKERTKRRLQLEDEMQMVRLSHEARNQKRQILFPKETNYFRLKRTKMDISMFDKISKIGIGAFGEVWLVRKIDTNMLYAMKILRKSEVLKQNQVAHVKAERDILAEADNEWVVKLYYSFKDNKFLYFVMEYIPGGDLMNLLIKFGIFPEDLARFYIAELVLAIESVHNMGFVHCDIKPDNVLIDRDGHIKLTDFGFCTGFRWNHETKYYEKKGHERQPHMDYAMLSSDVMDFPQDCNEHLLPRTLKEMKPLERRPFREHMRSLAHSLVGSPNYIAPELLQRSGYTQLCDWWSVGVIMYEMLVGQPPFMGATPADTQIKVINWESTLHIPKEACLSVEARDLILRLCTSQDRRLGANGVEEIKHHPFFRTVDWRYGVRRWHAPYQPQISSPTDVSHFECDESEGMSSDEEPDLAGRVLSGIFECDESEGMSSNEEPDLAGRVLSGTVVTMFSEPRESPEISASDRDSDDAERECGSNKPKERSENPHPLRQETIQYISKEPSTLRGPGDLPGDLESADSGYSSFPSEELTQLDPECSLKREDGAEIIVHAVCKVTSKTEKDWGSTEIMKIQQEPKEGMQGLALVPVTSLQLQTSVTTEPREAPNIKASNRDSDDDEGDFGRNEHKRQPEENPCQLQEETIHGISMEPSTSSLCRVNYRTEAPEETDEEPTLDPVMRDSSSVCSVSSQVNAKHTNTVDSQILPSPHGAALTFCVVGKPTGGRDTQLGGDSKTMETSEEPKKATQELGSVPVNILGSQSRATKEHRKTPKIQSDKSDSDDTDYGSRQHAKQAETQLLLTQENKEDISKKPSIQCTSIPGNLPGDLESPVSVSSYPSKLTTSELCGHSMKFKAEGGLLGNIKDNSPWSDKKVFCSVVTPEGGIVNGKGIRLVCPVGAVERPVSVSITLEDPFKYYGFLFQKDLEKDVVFGAPTIILRPNGYFFKKPVTLTTKFNIQDLNCSDVLVLHGTEAGVGKITWEDVTHSARIDEISQELTIELRHFSRIVVLLRKTRIRAKDFVSRINLLAFHYRLLVLLRKSDCLSEKVLNEADGELALIFVSEDVYHEQFYKLQNSSALVQLEKEQFIKLHVSRSETQGRRRISNNENLKVDIHVGEDYKLADVQQESRQFTVQASVWWNGGKVVSLSLKSKREVRSLCGTITVQGENGHTSTWHFSEEDLRGYVRSLLGVEDAIFNLIPVARSLEMPEEVMNQFVECWNDEDEQLNIILNRWSGVNNAAENLDVLRTSLEKLKQDHTSYIVTERGQMHIRNLREFATKNADAGFFRSLCTSVLRDLCIEMESSAEGVERAASSTDNADYFLVNHSLDNHLSTEIRRPVPEDVALKYRQLCSLSNEPCLKTLLAITPYLIQNIKEIYVDCNCTEPQNGLRGLSNDKIDTFVSNVQKAEQEENFDGLVWEMCHILEKLCLKNVKDQTTSEIKEMSESMEIRQMLKPLKRFFQHSRQDIRLYKRLYLFSRHLRDTMTRPARRDQSYVYPLHDVRNMLLSLIRFAEYNPSKIVRFELTDTRNLPLACYHENITYDKRGKIYCQLFRVRKTSEDVLRLYAIARVHIDGQTCEKGAFQSEIVLNASGEEAFNRCKSDHADVAVIRLEDKSSANLRVVLCSTQKEKLLAFQEALKRDLHEDCHDFRKSEITRSRLKMCSIETTVGAALSLSLVYKWGSEAVILDSKDFVAFADCSAGGACTPEIRLAGLNNPLIAEDSTALALASADDNFALASFDQLQKHGRIQCEKIEYHLHQTVNQVTNPRTCVLGNQATVNDQMPSQRALPEGVNCSPKRSITEGRRSSPEPEDS